MPTPISSPAGPATTRSTGGADADTIDGGAGNDTITFDGSDVSVTGGIGTDTLIVTGAATINLSAGNISGFEIVDASKSRVAVSITRRCQRQCAHRRRRRRHDRRRGRQRHYHLRRLGRFDCRRDRHRHFDRDRSRDGNNRHWPINSGDTANVTGFENVDASTSGAAVSITGDANGNWLTGGSGNDTISGGAGADTIDGGAGNDTIAFDGSDVSIAGGTGTDTLIVTGTATIDLSAGNISGFEIVDASTSGAAVSLTGDANANKLTGGSGNDTISGGAGADPIDGGAGNDTLIVTGAATINLSAGRSDLWRHGECHRLRECGCVRRRARPSASPAMPTPISSPAASATTGSPAAAAPTRSTAVRATTP